MQIFFLAISILLLPHKLISEDLFSNYDLKFSGELQAYHVEDLNSDGRKDLLLSLNLEDDGPAKKPLFALYLQGENGFSTLPDQTFETDKELIVFDIGDVVGNLNKEFVYFKEEGVFYYSLTDTGFALTPIQLLVTESIFKLPNPQDLTKWDFVSDLNADGVDEVIVPKIKKCEIRLRDSTMVNWLTNEIPLPAEPQIYGFYDDRYSVGRRAGAYYAIPYLISEDFNADGKSDLLAVYRDSLAVFCQEEDGFFSKSCHHKIGLDLGQIWSGAKIIRNRIGSDAERNFLMRITDLNADGLIDVVGLRISTEKSFINPYNEIRIHFGKRDTTNSTTHVYFGDEPDQIIKPNGTMLVLDVLDFNKDGKMDLITPVVKVGLTNIVRMLISKAVEIQAEFYLMAENGLYPEKPDHKPKMVVRFSYRGGATSPVYELRDFNGDGHLDAMSSQQEKTLAIFKGSKKNVIESKVSEKYNVFLPQNGELVRAMELNGDGKNDVIIQYGSENVRPELINTLRILLAN